ncbi:MAG: GIY-YIG nuclease family protein [bacterium]|nr:GIY-YIG nuclease family protein [bacterium]
MERCYVYMLFSLKDGRCYTSFTTNLKERLQQHACGEAKSTRTRLPLKLIHYEYFISKEDAEAREKFLKSGLGRKQIHQTLKQTLRDYEDLETPTGQ